MLLGQFHLCTPDQASAVLEDPREADTQIEHTGRVLLPDYLLQRLAACQPPFLFRLTAGGNSVYLGYPVFCSFRSTASQTLGRNCVLVPSWAAAQLAGNRANESSAAPADVRPNMSGSSTVSTRVSLSIETLPAGSFIRLRPLQPDDVIVWANPAATLNKKLREFACLGTGSVFTILYLDRTFQFEIKLLKPSDAVCVIDCDMQLEFDFASKPEVSGVVVGNTEETPEDPVLSEERLRRCGVKCAGAASSVVAASSDALLRDALARARAAADASARRWGSGVALATGEEVAAPAASAHAASAHATASAAAASTPNLAYEWGALTFTRPSGRAESSSATFQSAVGAANEIGGRGVRLRDSLTTP